MPRAIITSIAAALLAGCAAAVAPGGGSQAEVVFFDDFSGPTLDRSSWNVEVTGQWVNNEQQAYIDSPETLYIVHGSEATGAGNGALVIQPRYRPGFVTPDGKKFDFVSGRINTRGKVEFTYGTVAARMKLAAGAGLWPAFWVLGTGRWPDTGEIDVMEHVGDPAWASSALHGPGYSGNTPLVQRYDLAPDSSAAAWHVYSVDWTPAALVFRVDDREVYRVDRSMVERYGRWAFDNPKYLILNLALGGAYPEGVNSVKTPYPGLPGSTVEMIQRSEPRILVDWVRVTKN